MADFKEKFQLNWQAWQFKIASLFFLLGIFVFAVGLGLLVFKDTSSGSEVKVLSVNDDFIESADVVVDVGGAVNKPGVYSLKADSRVNDALIAAGGLSAEADHSRVNLASKVSDGQKIFVPSISQQLTIDNSPFDSAQGKQLTSNQGQGVSGLVSINNASERELDTLPRIGPVTAGKIINGRPYSSIDELVSKKAVTKSVFEKIKDLISI